MEKLHLRPGELIEESLNNDDIKYMILNGKLISTLDLSASLKTDFSYLPIYKVICQDNTFEIFGYNFEMIIEFDYNKEIITHFISHPICYDAIGFFNTPTYYRINFIDIKCPNYIPYIHRAYIEEYINVVLDDKNNISKYNIEIVGDICIDKPISSESFELNSDERTEFYMFLSNINEEDRYYIQILKEAD